ncbi:glycosyltransferase family 8 protein [Myriangium duriaei CBS 260.36]|uniref:Glycosyltransferase family 8 protein n=1 Tax=Myriangium duriaei CBS 260.36 TaxID=1168546 RepID=A0A9P4IZQ1_9PEZI|nr:glycosyltransferase family 8 protein [Myriangium duriaei CBS 260.36]
MVAPHNTRASCTSILLARPVRLLILAIVFCITVASLRWKSPTDVSVRFSQYLNHDRNPNAAVHHSEPGFAQEYADKDTNKQIGLEHARPQSGGLGHAGLQNGGQHPKAISKPIPIKPSHTGDEIELIKTPPKQSIETPETSPFAYVFYATEDTYACSVLVNIDRLQNKLKVDYPIYVLATEALSQPYLEAFKKKNVIVSIQQVPPLAEGSAGYYRDCLVKLLAFKMHHVNAHLKRVIMMDSDQLVLKNLDHLFTGLPEVDLAAPRAYWLGKEVVSSTLMVISLSDRLWNTIETTMQNITNGKYDMDLVNDVLGDTVLMLPGKYITINSHWETWGIPKWYHEPDQVTNNAASLHVPEISSEAAASPSSSTKSSKGVMAVLPKTDGVAVTSKDDSAPIARLIKRVAIDDKEEEEEEKDAGSSKLHASQAAHEDAKSASAGELARPIKEGKPVEHLAIKKIPKIPASSTGYATSEEEEDEELEPMQSGKASHKNSAGDEADEDAAPAKAVKSTTPSSAPNEAAKSTKAAKPVISPSEPGKHTEFAKVAKPVVPSSEDDEDADSSKAAKPVVPSSEDDANTGSAKAANSVVQSPGADEDMEPAKALYEAAKSAQAAKGGEESIKVADGAAKSTKASKPVIPAEAKKGSKKGFKSSESTLVDAAPEEDEEVDGESSDKASEESNSSEPKSAKEESDELEIQHTEEKQHPTAHTKPMGPKDQRPRYKELYHLYDTAAVLHFFALGKPWTWTYEASQKNRADAHPLFYEQFKEWRTAALELCPPGVLHEV